MKTHEEIARYGTEQSPLSVNFRTHPIDQARPPRTELADRVLQNCEKAHQAVMQKRKPRKETL